jgi:hypothetical protein
MSKSLQQHIKKVSSKNNPENNKTTLDTVGNKLKADPDQTISGYGTDLLAKSVTLDDAIVSDKKAKLESILASKIKKEKNAESSKSYNDIALLIEQKYPNDTDKWMSFGFVTTKDKATDKPIPDKPENCQMQQGAFPKTCTVSFDVPKNAENYTVEITKGDPLAGATYIVVKSPKIIYTTTNISFDVADDYLNQPLWAKITAHNAAGQSPASKPFGGMRIQ